MKLIINGTLPSINHMYANVMIGKRRQRVLTDFAQVWKNDIIWQAIAWRNQNKWKTATGKTIVRLWYYFPDHRKRDTHNTLKLLLDCFEDALIYENDMNALPHIVDFEVDKDNPRVEVEFEIREVSA